MTLDVSAQNDTLAVIEQLDRNTHYGETIGTLAMSLYYVYEDVLIDQLARDLEKHPDIEALGVIDKSGVPKGVIVRRELFDILGRQYGRDVYRNREVNSLTKKAEKYKYHKNIITVAGKMSRAKHANNIEYYLLVDDAGGFYGVFSNLDVMVHLSEQTQTDINLARTLQSNIVKESCLIEKPFFKFAAGCKMAKGVGGDYYSIKQIGDHRTLITICDVSGKGISASLLSSLIGGMLHVYDFSNGLSRFITDINSYIFDTFMLEKFVTALFIEVEENTGKLTVYDMGHSMGAANLYSINGDTFTPVPLKNSNIALGIIADVTTRCDEIILNPGERVIAITDGLTDQRSPEGKEFGVERIEAIINKYRGCPIEKIAECLYKDIINFRGSNPQSDDITMVLAEFQQ